MKMDRATRKIMGTRSTTERFWRKLRRKWNDRLNKESEGK